MHPLTTINILATRLGARIEVDRNYVSVFLPATKQEARTGKVGSSLILKNAKSVEENAEEVYKFMLDWEEIWNLRNQVTKKEIMKYVKGKLASSDHWATHALELIMSKQTMEEQNSDRTVFHNCVGFTGHDSPLLSSFAKQWRDRQWLSEKQMKVLKKTINKYWSQVIDASDERKLLKKIITERPRPQVVQTSLNLRTV